MTGWTLFFVVLGVGTTTKFLIAFIVWLDTPRNGGRDHEGVRAPEDATVEELPRCRAYKMSWRGRTGDCKASLFTSSGHPTLTFVGQNIPVSLGNLYALDMAEEREEPV